MKVGIHQLSKLVSFFCISCNNQFEVYSTIPKESLRMEVCANCHTFYTGKSSLNVKTGRIDIFNRRAKRSEQKRSGSR